MSVCVCSQPAFLHVCFPLLPRQLSDMYAYRLIHSFVSICLFLPACLPACLSCCRHSLIPLHYPCRDVCLFSPVCLTLMAWQGWHSFTHERAQWSLCLSGVGWGVDQMGEGGDVWGIFLAKRTNE